MLLRQPGPPRLADPELNHPFSHEDQHPQHVERLAAYWAEVLGGPAVYSESCGDESGVLAMHAGNGEMGDLGERFLDCFVKAMDDAGLPGGDLDIDPAVVAGIRLVQWPQERGAVAVASGPRRTGVAQRDPDL